MRRAGPQAFYAKQRVLQAGKPRSRPSAVLHVAAGACGPILHWPSSRGQGLPHLQKKAPQGRGYIRKCLLNFHGIVANEQAMKYNLNGDKHIA